MKCAGRTYVDRCNPDIQTIVSGLTIYPNPASVSLYVANKKKYPNNYKVEVYDAQGRLLYAEIMETS